MLAPRASRPTSRTSTTTSTPTLLDSSPPSSWSGGHERMPRSEWSDEGTEIPRAYTPSNHKNGSNDGVTIVRAGGVMEGRLIDFEDEEETREGERGMVEMTPAEKLKLLLKQMEVEVRDTTPAPARTSNRVVEQESRGEDKRGGWRDGRRKAVVAPRYEEARGGGSSPERVQRRVEAEEEEEESPPTPPPRITNPYIFSARHASDERRRTPTPPIQTPARIPSRAAVLHASTSRSPQSSPQKSPLPKSTPLEHFIATRPAPPPMASQPKASTSQIQHRSVSFSSTSSTHSRKGKERAQQPAPRPSPPISHPTPKQKIRDRPPRTPRRWSVELAPDDSADFAAEAEGLEIRGEVELDLEESGVYWEKTEVEDSVYIEEAKVAERSDVRIRGGVLPPDVRPKARETSLRSDGAGRSAVSNRLSRILSHPSPPPQPPPIEDTSLPALPEPDADDSHADDESDSRTLSSRRAALFRSSPRGSSSANRQPSPIGPVQYGTSSHTPTPNTPSPAKAPRTARVTPIRHSYNEEIQLASPEPLRVGMAVVSTPLKHFADQTITGQTPHPPGRWGSPAGQKGKSGVRFSPLRQELPADDSLASSVNTSIHRLKLSSSKSSPSPRESPAPKTPSPVDIDPDSSFISRLKTSITRTVLPKPSQTLIEAQQALSRASQASQSAQEKVEHTQRQWVDALSSLSSRSEGVREVVKQGWSWSSWLWWVSLEILLIWGVFRVTVDYATSSHYLSHLDPFSLKHSPNMALSIPLPTAVSGFIVEHRGSANFFDLLERIEIWRYLEGIDGPGQAIKDVRVTGNGGGIRNGRLLGGVPT